MSRKGTNPLPTGQKPPAPPNPPLLLQHDPRAFLRCKGCGQPILGDQPIVAMKGCSVGKSECLSFPPCYHAECVDRPNDSLSRQGGADEA